MERGKHNWKQVKNGNPWNCNLISQVSSGRHMPPVTIIRRVMQGMFALLAPRQHPPKRSWPFSFGAMSFWARGKQESAWYPHRPVIFHGFGMFWHCLMLCSLSSLILILSSLVLNAFMAMACVCCRLSAYLVAGAFIPSQSEAQCRHLGPFIILNPLHVDALCMLSMQNYASNLLLYPVSERLRTPVFRLSPYQSSFVPKRGYLEGWWGVNIWTCASNLFFVFPRFKCAIWTVLLSKRTLKSDVGPPTLSSFDWWLKFAEPVFVDWPAHHHRCTLPRYHPYSIWMCLVLVPCTCFQCCLLANLMNFDKYVRH